MNKAILRSSYTIIFWIIYGTIGISAGKLVYLILSKEYSTDTTVFTVFTCFIVSSIHSHFAKELYYSSGMRYWRAFYFSFHELYGMLMLYVGFNKNGLSKNTKIPNEENSE